MLVWMDLEMTGLDPAHDVIVEIATLVTDDELEIVAEGPDLVVHQPPEALDAMDDVVKRMHTQERPARGHRGVDLTLEEAGAPDAGLHQGARARAAHRAAVRQLDRHRSAVPRLHLPEVEDYLHYRSVDVSTIKELARRWYPEVVAKAPDEGAGHRALDDIRESVEELKYYRGAIFKPVAAPATAPAP